MQLILRTLALFCSGQVELHRYEIPHLETGRGPDWQRKCTQAWNSFCRNLEPQIVFIHLFLGGLKWKTRTECNSESAVFAVTSCPTSLAELPVPDLVHHHVHLRTLQQLLLCCAPAGHRHGLQDAAHHPLLRHSQRQTGTRRGHQREPASSQSDGGRWWLFRHSVSVWWWVSASKRSEEMDIALEESVYNSST